MSKLLILLGFLTSCTVVQRRPLTYIFQVAQTSPSTVAVDIVPVPDGRGYSSLKAIRVRVALDYAKMCRTPSHRLEVVLIERYRDHSAAMFFQCVRKAVI